MKPREALFGGLLTLVIAGAIVWRWSDRWGRPAPPPGVVEMSAPAPQMPDTAASSHGNRAPASTVNTLANSPAQPLTLRLVTYQGAAALTSAADTTGATYDLPKIFQPVNLVIRMAPEPGRAYGFGSAYLTQPDIQLLENEPPGTAQPWTVTGYMLLMGTMPGELGALLGSRRDRFAVFTTAHPDGAARPGRVLRTAAHELGHALNGFHDDGNSTQPCCSTGGDGTSVMNQDRCLDLNRWTFQLGTKEHQHFTSHPMPSLDPGGSAKFGECTTGHTKGC